MQILCKKYMYFVLITNIAALPDDMVANHLLIFIVMF